MFTDYNALSFNPFDKQSLRDSDCFQSKDFKEMTARLSYTMNVRGIAVFTADPGKGKTVVIRCFARALNPALFRMEYICLTTVGVMDFYRLLCAAVGVEARGSKPSMFRAVRDQLYYLYREKRQPLCIAVDECQYLPQSVLDDLKILMNQDYDSINCFSLVLCGEPHFNQTITRPVNEALRQRVVTHYDFAGLSGDETRQYIVHKISSAGGAPSIVSEAAITAVDGYAHGTMRLIDNLMTDALIIGAQQGKQVIDEEVILAAVNNQHF